MTYEEALKFANEKILAYDSEMADFLIVCKEALKKQIPRKPSAYKIRLVSGNEIAYDCPNCKKVLNVRKPYKSARWKRNLFCDRCGQAIDWSEEE